MNRIVAPLLWSLFASLHLALAVASAEDRNLQRARAGMVKVIEEDVRLTGERIGKNNLDPCVMEAMGRVPRHEFVPESMKSYAYENRPLPIGYEQTISQPYIVALMTDLLGVDRESVVLEVGTGSGYQAAILAQCAGRVYSIEIIKDLGEQARERLKRLGYLNVEVMIGDGYNGWKEKAPFHGIIVTAVSSHIPPPLIEQLKPGGRMVIPVGKSFMNQQLMLIEKDRDGGIKTKQILPVAFVPLTGGH